MSWTSIMPEFIEEETGRRLYHENETTLDIEKEIAKKFTPKKGEVTSSYMHRDMDEEEVYDVDRAIDADGNPVLQEKAKLTQVISEGLTVMQEVDDLNEGLNDTIKAIAEEMQIKPSVLKKAVRTAYKADFQRTSDDYAQLENILATVGKI